MDWKNLIGGAASIDLMPRSNLQEQIAHTQAVVQKRQLRDGCGANVALERVMEERLIGQVYAFGVLVASLGTTLVAGLRGQDGLVFASLGVYLATWVLPKVIARRLRAQR
ncbi:hypothetical protein D3C71_25570 [compost metagenome]